MKIRETMKRLNSRYDAWSMRAAERMIANLDQNAKPEMQPGKRPIGIWDLLAKRRDTDGTPK